MKKKKSKYYKPNIISFRMDEKKIPSVVEVMKQHPRIKRAISNKGIYLYIEDVTNFMKHLDNEVVMHISVSIGNTEQDCFNAGYYHYSKEIEVEEIANKMYEENVFGLTCERMINNYAPMILRMPAPCENAKKGNYVSTKEEKVGITYISESMCHSIISKLWKYSLSTCKVGDTWDDFTDATGLTNHEFYKAMVEFD